ncbi:MAG: pentapeptide repeat-containing protein [Hungatella hathewayi]|nr:pentapeptide repeat-containing protein [Hungatella hathewayi]
MKLHQYGSDIFQEFRISCKECSGLCCVALYFSKYDGFPADKAAGTPCRYLDSNFGCSIHGELQSRQMKGCLAYDCCGAGQIVTRLYGEENWKSNPGAAQEEFDVFVKIFYLQQTLWYISEVKTLLPAQALWEEADHYLKELHLLLKSSPQKILDADTELLRSNINTLLNQAWQMVKEQIASPAKITKKKDFMGHHFRKSKLNGCDFSSTLLIAANFEACDLTGCNFLGADMRDANIKNADLSESIFLTQGQINAAIGNQNTRIPEHLIMPAVWH